MKITLAQINPAVGALSRNAQLICEIINQYSGETDLIVFPEMVLTGYPPQDLLFESRFIEECTFKLQSIAQSVKQTPVILGTVRKDGTKLFNTAAVIQNGEIIAYRDKSLLPTYDVFDEDRYFSPAEKITPVNLNIQGKQISIGIEICEDLWDDDYQLKVTEKLIRSHADLIVNISASPFSTDRLQDRIKVVREKVDRFKRPFVYCNLVGAQDELIFDGYSFVIDKNSEIKKIAAGFYTDIFTVDLELDQKEKFVFPVAEAQIYHALSLGVKDYFNKTGHQKAVLGLSGGIDSALVAAIAANALGPENVLGVTMPSIFSSAHSISDSENLAKYLGINFETIPIKDVNTTLLAALSPIFSGTESGLAEENLQARIRGNILMAIANKLNVLVLNTGNKTETALGYCTIYGDMCGALGVISDLNKMQVYAVSRWINDHFDREIIPQNTIIKPPSAELKPDQVDPFDYEQISPLVDAIITENNHLNGLIKAGYEEDISKKMLRLVKYSEHKRRQAAPGLRISPKAFGIGRRYPIVNQFGR